MNQAVKTLMDYCIEQTSKGNDFFFNYYGHVDTFAIWGFVGKWELDKEFIEKCTCRLNELTEEKAAKWIDLFQNHLLKDNL